MNIKDNSSRYEELVNAIKAVRQYFILAGVFSFAVNVMMLVPIIYMMQVYDRVISSGSTSTLLMLTLLLLFLLSALGGFEWVRSMILVSASNRLEKSLRGRVFNATLQNTLLSGGANSQGLNDLSSLRQFLTGNGLFAFFDAPWFPIYVLIMFLFHFWFGVVAIIAGIVMVALAWTNEMVTTKKLKDANKKANRNNNQMTGCLRNAEVIAAMGMAGNIQRRQEKEADTVLALQSEASKSAGMLVSISKTFRLAVQSLILGLGALLALRQEISPGMMIAGSLLLGRALAPIDLLVGTWKGFSVARAQYDRLGQLLESIPATQDNMTLPAPEGNILVEKAVVVPPGAKTPAVKGITLKIHAGEVIGIIGPSASGKSSLARAILGIWPVFSGVVRLDGANIMSWNREDLGPYVGYLPQDIELFEGTVSENICRFNEVDPKQVVAAAQLAGVHNLILQLPQGYDTPIGGAGGTLSGGQRQRIGLARAVYGNPRLLVLDEPNSNLDDQGERELVQAIQRIKAGGCTVIVITHRMLVLSCVDNILVMKEGLAVSYGSRDQILAELTGKNTVPRQAAS
ncbi:MAG: type I secretion system permease/ATPase [Pseudomonadales bacterium]|nr:type I secretion system permease/ATPase [Pseudomonadales bacterium]